MQQILWKANEVRLIQPLTLLSISVQSTPLYHLLDLILTDTIFSANEKYEIFLPSMDCNIIQIAHYIQIGHTFEDVMFAL